MKFGHAFKFRVYTRKEIFQLHVVQIITKSSNEPKNRSNEPKNSYYMLSFFGVYTWTKKRLIKEQKNISNKIVQMKKKQMNKK